MAELVDAAGLGPVGLRLLEVRVLSPASSRTLAPGPGVQDERPTCRSCLHEIPISAWRHCGRGRCSYRSRRVRRARARPRRRVDCPFFDYRVYYALVIVAVALTIGRAVASPLHRGAWVALAAAVSSYATAEFLWLFLYSSADSAPYPSIADAFYLGFYPASYVGLILLLRARLRSLTPGVWVDGVTAAFAVGAVGSAVVVGVVLQATVGTASVVATNIAYPLADVILLSLVVGGFALTRWRSPPARAGQGGDGGATRGG